MMRPRSSSTTKSRTFSQTSARVRGSNVPSPEYAEIRPWMFWASGSRASRVRMDFLPHGFHSPSCLRQGLPNSRRGRTAGNIVQVEHRLQAQAGIEIRIESRVQLAQLLQRQISELTPLFNASLHGFTDLLVGQPERNPPPHQVGGGGP